MRGQPPEIEGMYPVNNFQAEVERKLFTHNLGHAALGYLGFLKGYSYVHESFDDPELSVVFDVSPSTKLLKHCSRCILKIWERMNIVPSGKMSEFASGIR